MELGPIKFAAAAIAEFDSTFARARFAREFNCALPEFPASTEQKCELKLDAARHPVLENKLRRQGRAILSIALALGGNETGLVISGPNTRGTTVALQTVGVAALSAQARIDATD